MRCPRMLKKSFAGHGPAAQLIDPSLWGGAMRCQKSVRLHFFSNLSQRAPSRLVPQ